MGPQVGERVEVYRCILRSYSDRLYAIYDREGVTHLYKRYFSLLMGHCQGENGDSLC
jgi:hypothetical protein